MDDIYLDKIQKYENLCNAYLQKADMEFLDNDGKHTKQECFYLQKAADVRSEMARISIGSEQEYNVRKVKEINQRLADVLRSVDPETYQRMRSAAAAKAGGPRPAAPAKPAPAGAGAGPAKPAEKKDGVKPSSVSEDTVQSWYKDVPKHSFADVTGMEALKEKLRACATESKLSALKDYLGISKQKSYIFVGPPGCGKTYIIEAFVHELAGKNYKYISLNSSEILSKYVGDAEKIITRLFEEAEACAPCVVFIDEIDGVCRDRSSKNLPEYAASITTSFLTGYNRIKSSGKPILFIGATNYPGKVDSAMLDRVELIHVPFPDCAARVLKFQRELNKLVSPASGFSCEEMGRLTGVGCYNYRDIERLCDTIRQHLLKGAIENYPTEEAALEALKSGAFGVDRALFDAARAETQPQPKEEIIRDLAAWFDHAGVPLSESAPDPEAHG